MRIGIDARFYGPRVGGGGIGRYTQQLVDHLQTIDQEHDYVLFLKKDNFHECKITNPRFEKVMADVHWYGLKEQIVMPRLIRRSRVDFIHIPHWNVPLFCPVPFLTTIHDLILIEDRHSARSSTRNPLLHGFKYAGFRTILETAIHASKHIFTVSQFSKQAILKHFGIKTDKITVTYNGILPLPASRSVRLRDMGVYEPYYLYVGNAYPHKNLEMMIEAFSVFALAHPHTQLVIAGRRDVFSRKLEMHAQKLGIDPHRIIFVDLPSDEQISALYKHAELFIFPSRLEGFGMPPLEALQCGTPAAISSAGPLPEIVGDLAEYFDPDDMRRLAEIMLLRAKKPDLFAVDSHKVKNKLSLYNWKDMAAKTLEVYKTFR